VPILAVPLLSAKGRPQRLFAAVLDTALTRIDLPQRAVFQQRTEKIQGLPNNRTNEMIRGCEIRSISGGPASRPLHDDSMEHRLVMHGF
jgi:hypothetical protein